MPIRCQPELPLVRLNGLTDKIVADSIKLKIGYRKTEQKTEHKRQKIKDKNNLKTHNQERQKP